MLLSVVNGRNTDVRDHLYLAVSSAVHINSEKFRRFTIAFTLQLIMVQQHQKQYIVCLDQFLSVNGLIFDWS